MRQQIAAVTVGTAIAVTLALFLVSGIGASFYCRGLYQDGAYYLYRMAEREGFYLYDPARMTTQTLRQAPVVAAIKLGYYSLVPLGRIFSFAMLTWPVLLVSTCWFIAPQRAKTWVLLPVIQLLVGFSTTSFEAVGEASIAAGYFWMLLFLLLFRTRENGSRLLFLLLCIPAFWIHEGACLLTPLLLWVCWLRRKEALGWSNCVFLGLVGLLVVSIIGYELRWMIYPRITGEREDALLGIYSLGFLYFQDQVNLPIVTATAALVSLVAMFSVQRPSHNCTAASCAIALGFVAFAAAMIFVGWSADRAFSPAAQALARYNPIFASMILASSLILALKYDISPSEWIRPPAIIGVIALALAQTVTDMAATWRWKAYISDFENRLANASGLIPWDQTVNTGNARRDREWQLMTVG